MVIQITEKDTQLFTNILEVNLFAFAYGLFHRDFSPINGSYCIGTHFFSQLLYIYISLRSYPENVIKLRS